MLSRNSHRLFFVIFGFVILFISPLLFTIQGYHYPTDIQIGETLIYKRHDYNFSTREWNPWMYIMYEIITIEDVSNDKGNVTIINALRWFSEDGIFWKQVPFNISFNVLNIVNDVSEFGTIAYLEENPIYLFSGFDKENLVIQSNQKIGENVSAIESNINKSLDEEDWVIVKPINEGYGVNIRVLQCGCSVEGGISSRTRNITYSIRGILQSYYFYERVDYGADTEANQQQVEQFLIPDYDFSEVIFDNLSSNWKKEYLTSNTSSVSFPFYIIPISLFLLATILILQRNSY